MHCLKEGKGCARLNTFKPFVMMQLTVDNRPQSGTGEEKREAPTVNVSSYL